MSIHDDPDNIIHGNTIDIDPASGMTGMGENRFMRLSYQNFNLLNDALKGREKDEVIYFKDNEGKRHRVVVGYGRYLLQYMASQGCAFTPLGAAQVTGKGKAVQ